MSKNIGKSINQLILAIETANGRAFIQSPLRPSVRTECQALAFAAGVPSEQVGQITDSDLCALYAVGRSAPDQVLNVASRIVRKLDKTNPLLDPSYQVINLKPDPWAEPAPSPTDWARVLRIAQDSAKAAMESVQEDLSAALAGIPDLAAKAAAQAVQALQPTNLIVTLPSAQPVALGTVHYRTADIIQAISAGVNVYLYGPAGSGKTTAARKVSEAFKLPFYFAAKVESEYMLTGFTDASGKAVRTPFCEAYERGGVFLFDELDASSPAAVVALNAALANGICAFPDGTIERHADFKCIAAGNTKLAGASRQYVGRAQLDAASIDRFAFIEFGYDNALEMALAPNKRWGQYVQAVRAAIEQRGLAHLVTPRATIDGCKLLEAGFTWEQAEAAVMWKGLDADTVAQIKQAADTLQANAA